MAYRMLWKDNRTAFRNHQKNDLESSVSYAPAEGRGGPRIRSRTRGATHSSSMYKAALLPAGPSPPLQRSLSASSQTAQIHETTAYASPLSTSGAVRDVLEVSRTSKFCEVIRKYTCSEDGGSVNVHPWTYIVQVFSIAVISGVRGLPGRTSQRTLLDANQEGGQHGTPSSNPQCSHRKKAKNMTPYSGSLLLFAESAVSRQNDVGVADSLTTAHRLTRLQAPSSSDYSPNSPATPSEDTTRPTTSGYGKTARSSCDRASVGGRKAMRIFTTFCLAIRVSNPDLQHRAECWVKILQRILILEVLLNSFTYPLPTLLAPIVRLDTGRLAVEGPARQIVSVLSRIKAMYFAAASDVSACPDLHGNERERSHGFRITSQTVRRETPPDLRCGLPPGRRVLRRNGWGKTMRADRHAEILLCVRQPNAGIYETGIAAAMHKHYCVSNEERLELILGHSMSLLKGLRVAHTFTGNVSWASFADPELIGGRIGTVPLVAENPPLVSRDTREPTRGAVAMGRGRLTSDTARQPFYGIEVSVLLHTHPVTDPPVAVFEGYPELSYVCTLKLSRGPVWYCSLTCVGGQSASEETSSKKHWEEMPQGIPPEAIAQTPLLKYGYNVLRADENIQLLSAIPGRGRPSSTGATRSHPTASVLSYFSARCPPRHPADRWIWTPVASPQGGPIRERPGMSVLIQRGRGTGVLSPHPLRNRRLQERWDRAETLAVGSEEICQFEVHQRRVVRPPEEVHYDIGSAACTGSSGYALTTIGDRSIYDDGVPLSSFRAASRTVTSGLSVDGRIRSPSASNAEVLAYRWCPYGERTIVGDIAPMALFLAAEGDARKVALPGCHGGGSQRHVRPINGGWAASHPKRAFPQAYIQATSFVCIDLEVYARA
ncbi:hypothetical protein GLOTRDRAFT_92051 [Gloeophyllum trabeum ATCC 11539]|uniref:Uncharacterized protein n=1 Tax=Gloeophyllum trabeum (strain ATCC 11539 / FP-39264 / Madison 617) TaxID=670483 RepID=S7QBU1_GLOTA|nr:uncharacterized protein GLOTRDRAFT_92051 [Gloeophyllum trabeum ATCC 11539]EPQ56828.1 hypothetical protein GLOTRDRAFT_92051 [Gloeophyllum trabeum ATCC 11539]